MIPSSVLVRMTSSGRLDDGGERSRSRSLRRSPTRRGRPGRRAPFRMPSPSMMGAALSSIGVSRPSRAMSMVWFASPTVWPSLRTISTGLSTTARVRSFTMRKTSDRSFPRHSTSGQPVSRSATGLTNRMRPAGVGGDDDVADAPESHREPGVVKESGRHRSVYPLPLLRPGPYRAGSYALSHVSATDDVSRATFSRTRRVRCSDGRRSEQACGVRPPFRDTAEPQLPNRAHKSEFSSGVSL